MTPTSLMREKDTALRERAKRLIPGGMYGHQSTKSLTGTYPQFFESATGAFITDVDGNEYIDLVCSYGPVILGHNHPAVEQAANVQREMGVCLDGPSQTIVDLAELLIDTVEHADWAIFGKNGTDATTACLTIARAHTGRRIVLAAKGSYHGAAPWCTPNLAGVLPSDRQYMDYYEYNDVESLRDAVSRAGSDLAAIIVTPFKHIEGIVQEFADLEFAEEMRRACDRTGAQLILDDVRCGFRLHHGSSWEPLGIRPDLSAWSKGIANGHSISAVLGAEHLRAAADAVFLTGSFWFNPAPMAAAIATINTLASENAVARIASSGNRLKVEIEEQAQRSGFDIEYSGHVSMPYLTFTADHAFERMDQFCNAALQRGLYLTPRHNWFLSLSHNDAIVDSILAITAESFGVVKSAFGSD